MRYPWLGLVVSVSVMACGAHVDDPAQPAETSERPPIRPPLNCSGDPGASPIRRLTRAEYNHTVRDLLGDHSQPANAFPREEELAGFNNNATVLGVTAILAEQYMRAAEGLARRAAEPLDKLIPCITTEGDESACMRQFIRSFGQRAFRGPLDDDEVGRLYAVFAAGRVTSVRIGVEFLLETMLQSARFLYRVEFGQQDGQPVVPLSSWEMASRLSYLFWNSMPDDELFAAAAKDQLRDKAQILEQAQRMMTDPKTRPAVANFHGQWLGLGGLASVTKSASVYPDFSEEIRAAMRTETERFLDDVMWSGAGDLGTLLSAPYTFMNAALAGFYGVRGPSGATFERVDLDPTRRRGLLTQASLLSIHAHSDQTSPVTRGKFIRTQFFCTEPPPPPPDVMVIAPDLDPRLTTRERFSAHAEQASCASCHRLLDPIGLGFEKYDAVGKYRESENGKPVDASGELVRTDVDGQFDGVPELAERLARSQQVRDCLVTQWFRFSYGRTESAEDACVLRSLQDQFAASRSNIRSLLLALTQTDAFLYRRAVVAAEAP